MTCEWVTDNPQDQVAAVSGPVLCRVCGFKQACEIAHVEFVSGYAWPIYDCFACGCRFTLHDNAAYEVLHSERGSCYHRYSLQLDRCKRLFERRDVSGLRATLVESSKYRFIIEKINEEPVNARFLEIGSARGHLTSYFILTNRRIIGVDISSTSVACAKQAFGDHFCVAGDPMIEAQAPYDVIFHVGTVGCLEDPVGTTRDLLRLLKPEGRLLFNAPNREGLAMRGQLWVEGAPPPDVVTIFRPGFWREMFGDVAQVSEEIEIGAPMQNLLMGLRNLTGRRWRVPVPVLLGESMHQSAPEPRWGDTMWRTFERAVRKFAAPLGLLRLAPRYPAEYGLFVVMRKH
jgi:SAM-dependent methyltransferase